MGFMNSKPLTIIGGIVVALVIIARLSKLRYLSSETLSWLIPVIVVIGLLFLITLGVLKRQQSVAEAKYAAMLETGRGEIRRRVIAAGLAGPHDVDRVIREMSSDDFNRIRAEMTYLRRNHF